MTRRKGFAIFPMPSMREEENALLTASAVIITGASDISDPNHVIEIVMSFRNCDAYLLLVFLYFGRGFEEFMHADSDCTIGTTCRNSLSSLIVLLPMLQSTLSLK